LCNVSSCWIYIGILLGAHPVLHISRIRVKDLSADCPLCGRAAMRPNGFRTTPKYTETRIENVKKYRNVRAGDFFILYFKTQKNCDSARIAANGKCGLVPDKMTKYSAILINA
jgi:hypothetical protein